MGNQFVPCGASYMSTRVCRQKIALACCKDTRKRGAKKALGGLRRPGAVYSAREPAPQHLWSSQISFAHAPARCVCLGSGTPLSPIFCGATRAASSRARTRDFVAERRRRELHAPKVAMPKDIEDTVVANPTAPPRDKTC